MGFYLEENENLIYISDSYLRYAILNNDKVPSSIVNVPDPSSELILNKLGVEIPMIGMDEIIDCFIGMINKSNIDKLSIILEFNRSHILAIFYLLYSNRIGPDGLDLILSASSYQSRSELLISYLREQDDGTIDILMPMFELIRKLSGYKNKWELASTGESIASVTNKLNNWKLDSKYMLLNQGNIFYEYNERNQKTRKGANISLLKYCDKWKGINLDTYSGLSKTIKDNNMSFENAADNLWVAKDIHYYSYESDDIKKELFNSSKEKFREINRIATKFTNAWKRYRTANGKNYDHFGEAYCKKKLAVNRAAIEEDLIAELAGTAAINKFNNRTNPNCKKVKFSSDEIESSIMNAFRVHFNHALRSSVDDDDIYKNSYKKDVASKNVFSLYDNMINKNDIKYSVAKVEKLKVAGSNDKISQFTSCLPIMIGTPFSLYGYPVGKLVKDTNDVNLFGTTISFKYDTYTGYIDILPEKDTTDLEIKAEILNKLSNLTAVKYDGIENITEEDGTVRPSLIRKHTGVNLTNHYFAKSHVTHKPTEFDFSIVDTNIKTMAYALAMETDIESLALLSLESFLEATLTAIETAKSTPVSPYNKPDFYNLKTLLKYDYLITDLDSSNGTGKFSNFGTVDFFNTIKTFLEKNNILTVGTKTDIIADPRGNIRVILETLESTEFKPNTFEDCFILSYGINIVKQYLEYLLDDNNKDIESCLKVSEFYYNLYKLSYLYRHTLLSVLPVISEYISNPLYIRLDENPMHDNKQIDKAIKFFEKYSRSRAVSKSMKSDKLTINALENMKVGILSLSDILKYY